jgi:small subunit ribosomal protein S20
MPIIKSAKKRVRVSAKAAARNAKTKRTMREAIKAFNASLSTAKADKIGLAQSKAVSAIDIATKKNVIHKNKAARKKSQLNEAVKKADSKKVSQTVKKPVKKADSKKIVPKKAAVKAKKPVSKKSK